jgi:two-component system response regulator HupR/HoxA
MEVLRQLRLPCWLGCGGTEVPGTTVAVGARTASLRFAGGLLAASEVGPRARLPLALRLPEPERVLRLEVEVSWRRDDDRDLSGSPATAVGIEWAPMKPAARELLDALLESYRHTALVVTPGAAEAAWLDELLSPMVHVARAGAAAEALAVFAERAVSVIVIGRAASDPLGLLAQLDTAAAVSHAIPLVLGPHPGDTVHELLDLGRIFGLLGKPLQADVVQQLVHRAVWLHELAVENERLAVELRHTRQRLEQENAYLRGRLTGPAGFERIIGSSPALARSLAELDRVRRSNATVHIQGETGTGKELVARALHLGGERGQGPFVAQNCGGIPETLLQSSLFGHVRGAFTGADRAAIGVFQAASGGTLFLDEVAELSPAVQAALLRALQEREVVPLGATRPVKVDVRVVSATHKDLRDEVAAGRFREDLFYRLMVVQVRLPPLRERRGDIALLAEHFLVLHCTRHGRRLRGFTADALRRLEEHAWPGNVRELENEIERVVVLADDGELVGPDLLSPHLGRPPEAPPRPDDDVRIDAASPYDEAMSELEVSLVRRALELDGGNLTHAARRLGMNRSRLSKIRERLRRSGRAL